MNRNRKTVGRCPTCYFYLPLCICHAIPRIELATKVCLIVHAKELRRTSNTGRLALGELVNSEMRVRGDGREAVELSDLLTPHYRSVLLYPSDDAVELSRMSFAQDDRPVQLIVPDGTWRQAGKIHFRHRELKDIQRVKISTPTATKFYLRAQHRDEGMATLQAVAHALGFIEGDFVKSQLMKLYDVKLEQTLLARGQVNLARSLGFTAKRDREI